MRSYLRAFLRRAITWAMVASWLFALAAPISAEDSTGQLLDARRISHALVLKVAGSSWTTKEAPLAYSLDARRFEPLVAGATFTASHDVLIAFEHLNPFDIQVTASEAESEDPNNTQLAQALDKLLGMPKALGIQQLGGGSTCPATQEIVDRLDAIYVNLERPNTAEELKQWRKEIDDHPGYAGVRLARVAIKEHIRSLEKKAHDAEKAIDALAPKPTETGPTTTPSPKPSPSSSPSASPAPPAKGSEASTPPLKGADNRAKASPPKEKEKEKNKSKDKEKAPAVDPCELPDFLMDQIQKAVAIANPRARLRMLEQLIDGLKDLDKALATYADDGNWEDGNYIIHVARPSPEKIKTVTIQAARFEYTFTDDALHRVEKGNPVSTKFLLRQHAGLVPEVAAGFVISGVRVPTYGTAKAADGSTVVALSSRGSASYAGAILLNLLCRCGNTAFAHPMLQIGVSSGGDVPSILAGVGLRFSRPRRVALSAGGVLAWVKDLDKLSVGSPVGGTAAIEADLKRHPTVKAYFALQYTF